MKDDRTLCILSCSDKEMSFRELTYIMYLLQVSGFNLGYSFGIDAYHLKSKALNKRINELIASGHIVEEESKIKLTSCGARYLDTFLVSADDMAKLEYILTLPNLLTCDELAFVCVTNIMVDDLVSRYSSDSLMKMRSVVVSNLKRITSCYTDENFDSALKLVRHIKEDF